MIKGVNACHRAGKDTGEHEEVEKTAKGFFSPIFHAELQTGQKPDGSFSADVVRSISAAEYKDWFEKEDGIGWTYMRALYDSKVGSVPEGSTPKTFEESVNFTFFLNAIANIAG